MDLNYSYITNSIAVIKPKQSVLDWIFENFSDLPTHLSLEVLRIDCNSYLIPEVNDIEDGINYIDENFETLFKLELSSWTIDEALWPKNRDLQLFYEWFDIEVYPSLIDLSTTNEESKS